MAIRLTISSAGILVLENNCPDGRARMLLDPQAHRRGDESLQYPEEYLYGALAGR